MVANWQLNKILCRSPGFVVGRRLKLCNEIHPIKSSVIENRWCLLRTRLKNNSKNSGRGRPLLYECFSTFWALEKTFSESPKTMK